jgi:hypothetical protein
VSTCSRKTERSDWRWSRDSIRSHSRRIERGGIWIIQNVIEDEAGLRCFLAIDIGIGSKPVRGDVAFLLSALQCRSASGFR